MIEFHPLADIFPLIEGADFDALVADIEAYGLADKIVMHEGKILDGRNRYRALAKIGPTGERILRCHSEPFIGTDPLAFVISKNVNRRHLSESQRAMVAARLATLRKGVRSDTAIAVSVPTQDDAAKILNVSVDSIQRAGTVLDQGTEELKHAVDQDKIAVSQAAKLAKATPEVQRRVLEKAETENVRLTEAIRKVTAEDKVKAHLAAPSGRFRIIYADPPWDCGAHQQPDYHSEQRDHYPVMTVEAICNLTIGGVAVKDKAEDDAVLFLWVTAPIAQKAFAVVEAWGFEYKAQFVWDKVFHNLGHYNSVHHELLYVCTRGSCQPDVRKLHDSVVSIERTEHSKKPEFFYKIIETLYPQGRRLEMFARGLARPGWDIYGYEAQIAPSGRMKWLSIEKWQAELEALPVDDAGVPLQPPWWHGSADEWFDLAAP